jgi:hypothetical protein
MICWNMELTTFTNYFKVKLRIHCRTLKTFGTVLLMWERNGKSKSVNCKNLMSPLKVGVKRFISGGGAVRVYVIAELTDCYALRPHMVTAHKGNREIFLEDFYK